MHTDLLIMQPYKILDDGSEEIDIGITTAPRKVSGVRLLAQIWAMAFLSESGKAVLYQDEGGGMAALVGSTTSEFTRGDLSNLVSIAISKVNEEIIRHQADEEIDDENEILATAFLLGIYSDSADSADVQVRVVSQAGSNLAVQLPIE